MRDLIESIAAPEERGLIFMFDIRKDVGLAYARMRSEAEAILGSPLEDGGEPHITSLYMGKGHTEESVQSIAEAAVPALREATRPMAVPGKVSTFPISPSSEGRTPVILLFDPQRLEPIHVRLLRATAKYNNQNQFVDYRPHMTLGYLPREIDPLELAMLGQVRPPTTLLPSKLVLSWGRSVVARYTFG